MAALDPDQLSPRARLHLRRIRVLQVDVDEPERLEVVEEDTRWVVRCPNRGSSENAGAVDSLDARGQHTLSPTQPLHGEASRLQASIPRTNV